MANGAAKGKKGSAYFSSAAMDELRKESIRLDRSVSWLLQRAWQLAREEIRAAPTRAIASSPVSLAMAEEIAGDQDNPKAA